MDPYKQVLERIREIALTINPKVDVSKIDLKTGPAPWDMSTNAAFILAASFKEDK